MADCIFCKIVAGEIPCRKVYEDEKVFAFEDIHPMAPVHVVIIPKRHVATLMDVGPAEEPDFQAVMAVAREVARIKGLAQRGFRVVINCNSEGGQTVFHLHAHLLGGLKLKENIA